MDNTLLCRQFDSYCTWLYEFDGIHERRRVPCHEGWRLFWNSRYTFIFAWLKFGWLKCVLYSCHHVNHHHSVLHSDWCCWLTYGWAQGCCSCVWFLWKDASTTLHQQHNYSCCPVGLSIMQGFLLRRSQGCGNEWGGEDRLGHDESQAWAHDSTPWTCHSHLGSMVDHR